MLSIAHSRRAIANAVKLQTDRSLHFCLAITNPEILAYVAAGTIFLVFSSVFILYGCPSMIFWAYASPTPGSATSCSFVAEFKSINSAAGAAAFDPNSTLPAHPLPYSFFLTARFWVALPWWRIKRCFRHQVLLGGQQPRRRLVSLMVCSFSSCSPPYLAKNRPMKPTRKYFTVGNPAQIRRVVPKTISLKAELGIRSLG